VSFCAHPARRGGVLAARSGGRALQPRPASSPGLHGAAPAKHSPPTPPAPRAPPPPLPTHTQKITRPDPEAAWEAKKRSLSDEKEAEQQEIIDHWNSLPPGPDPNHS